MLLRALGLLGRRDRRLRGVGVAKPDPAFFERLIEWTPGEPEEIVYVGDHPANDIGPTNAAGLRTAMVRRGPWGHLWADDPAGGGAADWLVNSLTDLPALLTTS